MDKNNEVKAFNRLLEHFKNKNENWILYKFVEGKEIIVVLESMQTEILKNVHEKGHMGIKCTGKLLKESYFISKFRCTTENLIATCIHILQYNWCGSPSFFFHLM